MRVLLVSNYPHLPDIHGGLQTTTHDLCMAIQATGACVAVLCAQSDADSGAHDTGAVYEETNLGYSTFRAVMPERALADIATAWHASVIVVQTGVRLLPMVVSSLTTGLPTAVYLHNVETHQLGGTLVSDPLLRYFANSDFTAERWRVLSGIDCCVIPPIVSPDRYWVEQTGSRVLFVNPSPIKGVEILFALAAACPEIPFVVYESWCLAPAWREHCLRYAHALGNIQWHPPTMDMREAYAQAKMLLMPSIWEESFGRTVIEAQLNGLPVLASHRGALPALVGSSGMTLDPHAPITHWIQALRQLYAHPSRYAEAAREMGMRYVSATPLVVGRFLSELTVHALATPAHGAFSLLDD